jgi:hypothetical protein
MYFALDPESLPKSTWQAGQATDQRDWRRSVEQGGVGDHRWDGSEMRLGWTKVKSAAGTKEGDSGAESSRWRSARAGNERTRDSGNCGGIEGRGRWRR